MPRDELVTEGVKSFDYRPAPGLADGVELFSGRFTHGDCVGHVCKVSNGRNGVKRKPRKTCIRCNCVEMLDLKAYKGSNGQMGTKKKAVAEGGRPNSNSIYVTDAARQALEEILGESDIPLSRAVEKMIYFLRDSGPVVAGSILKMIPRDLVVDVARMELTRLAQTQVDQERGFNVKGEPKGTAKRPDDQKIRHAS